MVPQPRRPEEPGKEFYTVPVPVPDHLLDQYDTLPTLQDMVMYAISAHTKHPNEAWELVKYLRTPEADMYWITEDLGAVATTLHALNSPEAAPRRRPGALQHELEHARPWPSHPGIISIARNVITPWCQKAIVGEISAEEAIVGRPPRPRRFLTVTDEAIHAIHPLAACAGVHRLRPGVSTARRTSSTASAVSA